MMSILKKYFTKNIIFLALLFVSPELSIASNTSSLGKIQSDYVLIINSYTESSDWSNSFIRPIYETLFTNQSDLTVYTEHMNMLMISNEEQLEEYKKILFEKYNSQPKVVIIIGNTPWELLRSDLETKWTNTKVIICAEESYSGVYSAYLEKYAIPKESRQKLTDYKGPLNLTIIHIPIFMRETIVMMKQMIPNMDKIIFLSDKRYVSAQNREELTEIIQKDYPEITLEFLMPDSVNINELATILNDASSTTGILYFSWYRKSILAGSIILTTNDYKMFSRYTNSPIFTLSDNEIATVGMLGGYFFDNKHISTLITKTFNDVLSGKSQSKLTNVDCGTPSPVVNHLVLTEKGFSDSIFSEDTIFYQKELTLWQSYKYWILFLTFFVISAFTFLLYKMRMVAKLKNKQDEQIMLMTNYNSLFDNMPIAYAKQKLTFDGKGNITDYIVVEVNPYYKKYFSPKISANGEFTKSENNLFHSCVNLYELALADKKEITIQYYHQDTGRYFSVIIVPSKAVGYMDIFYVDNTELSSTQQLLRTLNHKLSMALEVANITPWRWDLDKGTILCNVNRVAGATSEVTEEQLSVPYYTYFSMICKRDLERIKQAYDDLLTGKIHKIKEEYRVFVHRDNKKTYDWVEVQAIVDKRDDTGRPLSLIGSSLKISDRKKMESDLVDAKNRAEEANRLKSAFLANMSHEIRTPLNAIVGFSEVLASAEDEDEKHEYVSIIENNNTLLLQLISDILDLSKIEAGTLEFIYSDVHLNDLFTELKTTFEMRMHTNDVEIIFDKQLADCYIYTDKNRLSQVVINMVNNAMKFTTKGSITFGFSMKNEKTLYFYVKDTGCGIPAERVESVFGRFIKLNSHVQGTGLGLSICQTIIHNMGGEIGVESEEGKGSTFWFTVPYKPSTIKLEIKDETILQPIDKGKLTVLVAEDNPSNFKLFEAILHGEYKILHAWNGEEAVQLFKEHKPHIVLMDINMPKMNGYEATKQIREISAKVPIIAVTAFAYASDEQRIINSGFDGYTAKPINSKMLKSQMINLLKRQLIFM